MSSSPGTPSLTGLFQTEEKCIVFLDIVQELMNSTLMDAYRSAANLKFHEVPSVLQFTPYIAERFRFALDLIPNWPYQILQQEEERAIQRCSAIHDCYRYLVEAYAKDLGNPSAGGFGGTLGHHHHGGTPLPLPPLPAFLHDIYNEFVCIPEVRNGVYFQMYGIHRKNTIADAIRAALRKLVSKLGVGSSGDGGNHHYAAAAPYMSPGPSISQRVAASPAIAPQLPPQPPRPSNPAPTFPDLPKTPKSRPQPPRMPPTPATSVAVKPPVKPPAKTPFQRAIEIDMQAQMTPTPKHDRDAFSSDESED